MIDAESDLAWVFIINPKMVWPYCTEEEQLEHNGKWLIRGSESFIKGLAKSVEPLVEAGEIIQAKYTKKDPRYELFPDEKHWTMCVYADDRNRETVLSTLASLGVSLGIVEWKYDRQTLQDWSKNGRFAAKLVAYSTIE